MFSKGEIISVRGILIDMTDHTAMQNALRESESKYKMLVEKSTDGICITQDAKYKFVNSALCLMVGYTEEELYNKQGIEIIAPEYRQKMLEIHQRRMAGDISSISYQVKLLCKNGELIDIDAISSTLEYNGRPAGFFTLHDVTASNRLQQTLIESEEKYRLLIDEATDGIVITKDGLLKFANNAMCEMLLYSWKEIADIPFLELVVKEDRQVMTDLHKRRMTSENFTSLYRSRIIRKDKKIITVELNSRTSDYNGDSAAFIIIRDINDRIKIENELQAAKDNLEQLNIQLEQRVRESSESLTEARTQLIKLQKENLQERPSQSVSTGVELKNIQNRYLPLNNTQPVFKKTETHFIAKVLLVRIS